MRAVIVACALLLTVFTTGAQAQNPDLSTKQKFVVALQNAIRTDDKNWLADRMSYPVNYFGKRKVVIRNRAAFIGNYSSFSFRSCAPQCWRRDPANVFENWQGVMIGGGNQNIWVTKVGDADSAPYQIITINDADPPSGGK